MTIWLRSWPDWEDWRQTRNQQRAYVMDDMERCLIHEYDYTPLLAYKQDICLLEWDVAADKLDRERFQERAERTPNRVLVAPYRLHHSALAGRWAHRIIDNHLDDERWIFMERWLHDYEISCDLFGFGMIYLPYALIARFCDAPAPERGRPVNVPAGDYGDMRFHDQTFSMWHFREGLGPVTVDWSVHPVHLHE